MSKKPKFAPGDVTKNKWGDKRIIFAESPLGYYFITQREGQEISYYLTNCCVGHDSMEKSFEKIGTIENLEELRNDIMEINMMYAPVNEYAREQLNKYKTFKPL